MLEYSNCFLCDKLIDESKDKYYWVQFMLYKEFFHHTHLFCNVNCSIQYDNELMNGREMIKCDCSKHGEVSLD